MRKDSGLPQPPPEKIGSHPMAIEGDSRELFKKDTSAGVGTTAGGIASCKKPHRATELSRLFLDVGATPRDLRNLCKNLNGSRVKLRRSPCLKLRLRAGVSPRRRTPKTMIAANVRRTAHRRQVQSSLRSKQSLATRSARRESNNLTKRN